MGGRRAEAEREHCLDRICGSGSNGITAGARPPLWRRRAQRVGGNGGRGANSGAASAGRTAEGQTVSRLDDSSLPPRSLASCGGPPPGWWTRELASGKRHVEERAESAGVAVRWSSRARSRRYGRWAVFFIFYFVCRFVGAGEGHPPLQIYF